MKEPFANLQSVIDQTQALADLELKSYLASLSGTEQSELIAGNVDTAVKSVLATKSTQFSNYQNQLLNADNSVTSAAYYLLRSQDLQKLAKDVDEVAAKQVSQADINKQLAGRQFEINEWSNSNKLDTLFFMQVLFISLTLTGVLLFLMMNGLLPQYLFGLFSFFIAFAAVLVLILRARFTSVKRDSRYWSKQRFNQPT
jgi:hypothetical protein